MEASPSSLFLEKSIRCGSMLAREAGMGPESWLWDSTRLGPGLLNDPKESGIGPVSLFRSRRKDNRLGNRESELGMGPERLLKERSRNWRLVSWARKSGTGPDMLVQLI
ncbi:hypothetical protein V8G54_019818 [Vigna mungo]|uniref:Uncharacterized protein n=1 Tax=Vigna mungo TaxID=3915 RepID=A0AAQ3NCE7_VIGMU